MKVIINAKPKEIAELINTLYPQPALRANPLDKILDAMTKDALKVATNDTLNGTSDKEPRGISNNLYATDDVIADVVIKPDDGEPDPVGINRIMGADIADAADCISNGTCINPAPIYGVSGMYSEYAELYRTDDAVGLDYAIDRDTGEIISDFNDVFPWNKTEIVEDAAGNKFVSFPEMYFRIGADDNHRLTEIAVSERPSGAGSWHKVAPFMYGCYGGSIIDGKLMSVPDVIRANYKTRDDFRYYARNNGTGYHQLDLYHHTVLMFLWYIEFATKNDKSIMTGRVYNSGKRGGCSMCMTGGTDNLGTPSGFDVEYGQMRYHYIEDFIGNLFEYVDGVVGGNEGENDYVTDDPERFSDDKSAKHPLAYTIPPCGYVTALGWDSDNPFMCLPAESSDDADNTHFFTYSDYANASYPVLYCGAHYFSASSDYGLTYFCRDSAGFSNAYRGGRLLKS